MRAALVATRSAASTFGRRLTMPVWTVAIMGLGALAWMGVLMRMAGMDEGPGTPLHGLPAFLVGWVLMLTAMMLPSELNYLVALGEILKTRSRTPGRRARAMAAFVTGYGIAWLAYGLAAYGLDRIVRTAKPEILAWDRAGPYRAGAVLILASLYQISRLKDVCLTGCRTPLAFFARYWKDGALGAVAMGTRHGLVCVGCCWALMAVMFAVGAMSLVWMALLTLFMFAEKILPRGRALTRPIAGFLFLMGIWIAISPSTAPLLKNPMMFGASFCRAPRMDAALHGTSTEALRS